MKANLMTPSTLSLLAQDSPHLDQVHADLCQPGASEQQLRERVLWLALVNEKLRADLARALTCPVTQLPNRYAWMACAERFIAAQPASLLLVDMDHFKPVNDRYGHHVGDAVLAEQGQRLQQWCTRLGGHAGRLGGDEFAAVVPTGENLPESIASLRAELLRPIRLRGVPAPLVVGASLGIALATGRESLPAAMHAADVAMYREKGPGRGHRRARVRLRGRRFADVLAAYLPQRASLTGAA